METSPSSSSSSIEPTKVFVGGIMNDLKEEVMKDYFQKFGEVKEIVLIRNRITGTLRGFGFVEFVDLEAAEKAINVEGKHLIGNSLVEVKRAKPRAKQWSNCQSPHDQCFYKNLHDRKCLNGSDSDNCINEENNVISTKIFVGGLSANVTEDDFRNYFEKFGSINDSVIIYDTATRRPRGFGFITFDSKEGVEKATENKFHELNGKFVEVKRAFPRVGNHHPNGSSCSSRSISSRIEEGLVDSYDNFAFGVCTPYDYYYGCYYNYTPLMVPGYAFGQIGYGGGYAYGGGYGMIGYGAPFANSSGSWNEQIKISEGNDNH
ncbi:hypothetical protein HPP92_019050 [Vanilla planifolia]|uniref:RRM domain-containing protein n=1 Tax=Vanilla planifolia TaxID=51239 RepID=A0A835Q276_VANPL|nr:hypothetical protein HPP92_019050 [Vanilla planifolia]